MIYINVIRDKIRKRVLYIVSLISILIMVIFTTGKGSISINGVPITDFKNLIPILFTFINMIAGALSIGLSLSTIPKEYETKTSHLIWVRDVPQYKYHGELALGNMIISIISSGILYLGIVILTLVKGEYSYLIRIIPSFLLFSIPIVIISLFTSVISIKLSPFICGIISVCTFLMGTFHSLLDTASGMISGFGSYLIKGVLLLIPNLSTLQKQSSNYLVSNNIDIHIILGGLVVLYIISLFLYLFKKKEA